MDGVSAETYIPEHFALACSHMLAAEKGATVGFRVVSSARIHYADDAAIEEQRRWPR